MRYVLALMALLATGSANAITYDFSGVIDERHPDGGRPDFSGIVVGSTFSGFLEYDPSSFTQESPATFVGGITDYEFSLGGQTYSNGPLIEFRPSDFLMRQSFTDVVPRVTNPATFTDEVFFFFTGLVGVLPASLDTFDTARLFVSNTFGGTPVAGPITSFVRRDPTAVPEPGTWALLAIGFVGVALTRRSPVKG